MEPTLTQAEDRSPEGAPKEPDSRARIIRTPGVRGGKPRLDGHRITVADVAIWYERMGMNPDEIVSEYPTLSLSDVHVALAYYYDHREEIDRDIREGESFADRFRAGAPSLFEELKARPSHAPDYPVPSR
jgi:uncharacterized protein (DUF433 family)